MRYNRCIRYDSNPNNDIGQSSEYHQYDDLESICVTGITGMPENMDYDMYNPSIDEQYTSRSKPDFYFD
jgi:hypothetical protein